MLEVIKEMILITGLTGTSGSAFYDVLCREILNNLRIHRLTLNLSPET